MPRIPVLCQKRHWSTSLFSPAPGHPPQAQQQSVWLCRLHTVIVKGQIRTAGSRHILGKNPYSQSTASGNHMSLFVLSRRTVCPQKVTHARLSFPWGPPCCSHAEEDRSCGAKPTALFQKTELDTGAFTPAQFSSSGSRCPDLLATNSEKEHRPDLCRASSSLPDCAETANELFRILPCLANDLCLELRPLYEVSGLSPPLRPAVENRRPHASFCSWHGPRVLPRLSRGECCRQRPVVPLLGSPTTATQQTAPSESGRQVTSLPGQSELLFTEGLSSSP